MEIIAKYYILQAIVTLIIAVPVLLGCVFLIIKLDKDLEDRWYAIMLAIFLTIMIITSVAEIIIFAS